MLYSQADYLTILTHADAEAVKLQADALLDQLAPVTVLVNRTGLVMLPYTDTVRGSRFHLGEVLVSEARVRIGTGAEGYAVCLGRDLVQALAIALIDAALTAGVAVEPLTEFITAQAAAQHAADAELLAAVGHTRVELETF